MNPKRKEYVGNTKNSLPASIRCKRVSDRQVQLNNNLWQIQQQMMNLPQTNKKKKHIVAVFLSKVYLGVLAQS